MVDQLREQVLERVQLEADLRKDQSDSDIGPFYGLPTKVKHLFENQRGIKSLYGKNKLMCLQQNNNALQWFDSYY